jgi:uncharacterized protein YbaA (DUF1428 family)
MRKAALKERSPLVITRTYPVAPKKVWRAWIEPEALMQWWNQANVPGRRVEIDVRVGGREVVLFSWIVFKSRSHRDRVNAKVMKDPRLADMMDPKSMRFDMKRMIYGGFRILVDL